MLRWLLFLLFFNHKRCCFLLYKKTLTDNLKHAIINFLLCVNFKGVLMKCQGNVFDPNDEKDVLSGQTTEGFSKPKGDVISSKEVLTNLMLLGEVLDDFSKEDYRLFVEGEKVCLKKGELAPAGLLLSKTKRDSFQNEE